MLLSQVGMEAAGSAVRGMALIAILLSLLPLVAVIVTEVLCAAGSSLREYWHPHFWLRHIETDDDLPDI